MGRCSHALRTAHAISPVVKHILGLITLLGATSAFATGERVNLVVTGGAASLKDDFKQALCVSLECGSGRSNVTIRATAVKGAMELSVDNGRRVVVGHVPLKADGRVSATDLAKASVAVFAAIETPNAKPAAAAQPAPRVATAKKAHKLPKIRLAARGR